MAMAVVVEGGIFFGCCASSLAVWSAASLSFRTRWGQVRDRRAQGLACPLLVLCDALIPACLRCSASLRLLQPALQHRYNTRFDERCLVLSRCLISESKSRLETLPLYPVTCSFCPNPSVSQIRLCAHFSFSYPSKRGPSRWYPSQLNTSADLGNLNRNGPTHRHITTQTSATSLHRHHPDSNTTLDHFFAPTPGPRTRCPLDCPRLATGRHLALARMLALDHGIGLCILSERDGRAGDRVDGAVGAVGDGKDALGQRERSQCDRD